MIASAGLGQIALLVLCGSLSTVLVYELMRPQREYAVPDSSFTVALPAIPELPTFDPPPAELLVEVSQRPLFSPKRQAFEQAVESREAQLPPPVVAFIGTITRAGQTIAMVKSAGSQLALSLAKGSLFEGWEVTDISQERILFSAHSTNHEVRLNQTQQPPALRSSASLARPPRAVRGRTSNSAATPESARPLRSRRGQAR